jgi:subtilisin family serine protease
MIRSSCQALLAALAAAAMFIMSGVLVAAAPLVAHASAAQIERPRRGTVEYRLSWGVGASRADRAYRKGATGRGVIAAMIDTGVDASSTMMFRDLSPASTDLVPNRREDAGDHQHGARTASLLAARLDGRGTFGLAYDATLLSIRADRDGSCLKICSFDIDVLARAVDYAVDHGAQVIGMPMASGKPIPLLEAALERALAHGVVVVAAAGNDGAAQPVWPARYAADPRFSTAMIVAGASTGRGRLADWSNKAGLAKDRYLAAPGERVVVDCGSRTCSLVSGTSYSVAYTAGAVALLLSRNPRLTGEQAAAALLSSANDLAAPGADDQTGRGRLDIGRALQMVDAQSSGDNATIASSAG